MLDDHPAATDMQTALAAYRSSGLLIFEPTFNLLLAEVYHRAGENEAARSAVKTSFAVIRRTGEIIYGPRLQALARTLVSAPP